MSELLPCPSTIPPAQPSKVVAALRELVDCADADRILAMYTPGYRWYDAIVAARAALAELGEGRS